MERGKKRKRGRGRAGQVVSILVCMAVGAACGLAMARVGDDGTGPGLGGAARMAAVLLGFAASVLLQLLLHEGGHLVFGLLSGYRFCSFRIGSHIWLRRGGHIVHRRYSLAGTGGQCLMAPPDIRDAGRLPVALYNLGGPLMNLLAGVGSLLLARALPDGLVAALLQAFGFVGLALALTNGIPLFGGVVDNDGANTLSLLRGGADARRAFWVQFKVNEAQTDGVRLRDMPAAWFDVPCEGDFRNSMMAGWLALRCSWLLDRGRVAEADAAMEALLDSDAGILGIHRALLENDRRFLACTGDAEGLPELPERARKVLKGMHGFPAVLRTAYAEALCAGKAAEAGKLRAQLEEIAAAYPYEGEVESERDLMDRAAAQCGSQRNL